MQKWFYENDMVLNLGKDYCLLIDNHDEPHKIKIIGTEIAISNNEKLLDKSLCKKAGQKLRALSRTSSYLTLDQKFLLINSVIKSQFSYCPSNMDVLYAFLE